MGRPDIVVGSVLKVLNDSSLLEDPVSSRNTGSFFYGPNQKLVLSKFMPKGMVEVDSGAYDNKSFGLKFTGDNTINISVSFFTNKTATGSGATANLKRRELINAYMELIKNSLRDNQDTIGFPIVGIGTFDAPVKFGEQGVLVGTRVFNFRYRD